MLTALLRMFSCLLYRIDNRLSGCHSLRDKAEDLGLDVCPVGIAGFIHGNEVRTIEH